MTKILCTRELHFCAGHRVFGHESTCNNFHGHNYTLFCSAEADHLDTVGRVIDFSVIKERLGRWLDENWDHGFIAYVKDEQALAAIQLVGTKLYVMYDNPTAENMAAFLIQAICPELFSGTGVRITKIVLWETERCCAEVTL